eukprot:scaffold3056_cov70-Phaeocystis_antarctica.AAC.8
MPCHSCASVGVTHTVRGVQWSGRTRHVCGMECSQWATTVKPLRETRYFTTNASKLRTGVLIDDRSKNTEHILAELRPELRSTYSLRCAQRVRLGVVEQAAVERGADLYLGQVHADEHELLPC